MKFEIINDTAHGVSTWVLVTNSGSILASSPQQFPNVQEAQTAIQQFKTWVNQAPIVVVDRMPAKDWKQQAMEQLKKTPWQKG